MLNKKAQYTVPLPPESLKSVPVAQENTTVNNDKYVIPGLPPLTEYKPQSNIHDEHEPITITQQPSKQIADMQQAIIDFAQEVSLHDIASKTPQSKATDPFANFLSNQYVNKDRAEEKQNIPNLINSIKNIGTKGSSKPDGIWGPRTNDALWNIIKFIGALISLKQDLGISHNDSNIYKNYLENLPNNANDWDLNAKNKAAPELTKKIKEFENYYKDFREVVLVEYKDQINGQELVSEKKLDEKEQSLVVPRAHDLTIAQINDQEVKLADIYTKDAFAAFLPKIGIDPSDRSAENINKINSVINTISQSLGKIQLAKNPYPTQQQAQ